MSAPLAPPAPPARYGSARAALGAALVAPVWVASVLLGLLAHALVWSTRIREIRVRWVRLAIALVLWPLALLLWVFSATDRIGSAIVRIAAAAVGALAIPIAIVTAPERVPAHCRHAGRELRAAGKALELSLGALLRIAGIEYAPRAAADAEPSERGPALPPSAFDGLLERLRVRFGLRASSSRSYEERYRALRALPAGGSGAMVLLVEPRDRRGQSSADAAPAPDDTSPPPRYVLKCFDLTRGARLEDLVREHRSLDGARRLGVIVDHHLDEQTFWYVMPYYEGSTLAALDDPGPLAARLRRVRSLLVRLEAMHAHGLVHKDLKPQNLIVQGDELVPIDFGLLTDVRSALTVTTHGTEYFRDPDMVRQAIAGKKVHEVDARRFDVYSVGAVLYAQLEGSFPACGALSRYTRPVPLALQWVTRRAMADGQERYPDVETMRTDLEACIAALERGALDALRPAALPSFRSADADDDGESEGAAAHAGSSGGGRGKRSRWSAWTFAAAAAVLATIALWYQPISLGSGLAALRGAAETVRPARSSTSAASEAHGVASVRAPRFAGADGALAAALADRLAAYRDGPLAEALLHRHGAAASAPVVVIAMAWKRVTASPREPGSEPASEPASDAASDAASATRAPSIAPALAAELGARGIPSIALAVPLDVERVRANLSAALTGASTAWPALDALAARLGLAEPPLWALIEVDPPSAPERSAPSIHTAHHGLAEALAP